MLGTTSFELNNVEKTMGWIAGGLLFLLIRPYFVWYFVNFENWYAILPLYVLMLFNTKIESSEISYYFFFFLLTLFASFCEGANVVGVAFAPLLTSLFIASKRYIIYVYKRLWIIYCSLMALSITVFILLLFGIDVPGVFLPPLNELKDYFYMAYPFLVVANDDLSWGFCALFDEKGVVGTMSMFFLFIEKCNFKKVGNIIILISGILSMSLFFYGLLFIYLAYLMFCEKSYKAYRLPFLCIIIVGSIAVATTEIGNEKILNRLSVEEKSDDRLFAGDNRASEDLKYYISRIRGTSDYFFGTKNKNIREMAQGSASIQNVIVRWGLVTFILYLFFYLLFSVHHIKHRKSVMLFMLFLLLSLYNRPYIFNPVFVFLFNMALFSCSAKMQPLLEWQKNGK